MVECISSLLRTNHPRFEIVLVDNASTDGSLAAVQNAFRNDNRLKILSIRTNLGFAGGNNVGLEVADSHFVALMNPDTTVDPDWTTDLISTLEQDAGIGVVQPKIVLADDKSRLDSVGHYLDRAGIESPWSNDVTGDLDRHQYERKRDIFYAKGAAMFIRREVLHRAGFFDSEYFTDHEEIDLCWRIRLAGHRISYVPGSVVYHARGGASWKLRRENPQGLLFHLRKNHITTLVKNYELHNAVKYSGVYLTYLILHGAFRLSRGDVRTPVTYLRAIVWVLRNLPNIWGKRLWVQTHVRRVSDQEIMKLMTPTRIPLHFLG